MGLASQFRVQWAKVERTQAKFEKVDHEYHTRVEGYKDGGIPFSERIQAKLVNSIRHWKDLRTNQSAELLRLHLLMMQKGEPVDRDFDRKRYEGFIPK
jgi:hypothetical protein